MVKWSATENECGWYRAGAYGTYHLKLHEMVTVGAFVMVLTVKMNLGKQRCRGGRQEEQSGIGVDDGRSLACFEQRQLVIV